MIYPLLTASLLLLSLGVIQAAPASSDEGESWWSHVKILADDKMEGRDTGSEGYRKAAAYVAGEFRRIGLKPGGTKGYYQPVTFRVRQIIEEQSSLELVSNGQSQRLSLSEDANFGLPSDVVGKVNANAIFVGHGLVIPEMEIDDLAGLDLKGKIAVVLSGGSKDIPGAIKAHYSHPSEQWKALHQAGAIGIASIRNPKAMDIPWSRATLARLNPGMSLADSALNDTRGLKFVIRINPAKAERFFAGTGRTFADLLKLADENKPLPKFSLQVSIRAKVAFKKSQIESMNLAGVLEGSDPKLKHEYVVLSAHLDHLGVGQPIEGDAIYNGAMDNAAGISSLLEVARLLQESGSPLHRSILFLAVTGEEKGLQGSKYFAHYPTVPKHALVANLNTDMFLPLFPLKRLKVLGLGESTLGDEIRSVCSAVGVSVQPDPQPERNSFIRSDQYSFIRQGIPALAFGFGYELGSPEHKLHQEWLRTRYHAPSDDLNQPLDLAAAAQFNRLLLAATQRIANHPERPRWNLDSFFRRFAEPANKIGFK
ncbi:MAG: M28 family peptidase [Pedosphaera sp.]|nr:M28 family peptidase [Pedosphaera sp.]